MGSTDTSKETINQGLEGVVIAETKISRVDGIKGELIYAGHLLEEVIASGASYEDVFFMFLHGHLPSKEESKTFTQTLAKRRVLSAQTIKLIDTLPKGLDYMDAFRSGVSVLGGEMDTSYPPTKEQAMDIVAKAPTIVSRYYRRNNDLDIIEPNLEYGHVANYLYMLTGQAPDTADNKAYAHALDIYFITTIEHGMNASTFTARVATSTQADLVSSIVAAICTMKGPLHGGAPSKVIDMLEAIGTKENAEPWIRDVIERGERLMGFGHRVYKSYDPRAKALQEVVAKLPSGDGNKELEFSRHVEKMAVELLNEYKPGRNLYPNVEFGAAAVLRAVGLPAALYPTTFGVARCGGWAVHAIEQSENNRLIRPSAKYVGDLPKK